jgi:hypothetical protein
LSAETYVSENLSDRIHQHECSYFSTSTPYALHFW